MKLTIIDKDSQQPLLVLADQDGTGGIQIVGGDPKVADALKLNQFRSLKEVADYVNHEGSNLQAIADEQSQDEEQPDAKVDDRVKPALDILKQLLARVSQRQEDEEGMKQTKQVGSAAETMDAQVIAQKPYIIYVSLDGDNIGNAVARAEEKDDEQALADISAKINAGQKVLQDFALKFNGSVVEAGGDEGLIKVPSTALQFLEELRAAYANVVGATCTVGVGKKISESTKARMLGKLKGKNRVEMYTESTPKELELRLQDQDKTEASKIRTAMSGPTQEGEALRDGTRYNSDEENTTDGQQEESGQPQEDNQAGAGADQVAQPGATDRTGQDGASASDAGDQEGQESDQESNRPEGSQGSEIPEDQVQLVHPEQEAERSDTPSNAGEEPEFRPWPSYEGNAGDPDSGQPTGDVPPQEGDEAEAEGQPQGFSPELMGAFAQQAYNPKVNLGNSSHDPDIEDADYSGSESDPEVIKRMRYALRYGNEST